MINFRSCWSSDPKGTESTFWWQYMKSLSLLTSVSPSISELLLYSLLRCSLLLVHFIADSLFSFSPSRHASPNLPAYLLLLPL